MNNTSVICPAMKPFLQIAAISGLVFREWLNFVLSYTADLIQHRQIRTIIIILNDCNLSARKENTCPVP
jgi:hypothetical protein